MIACQEVKHSVSASRLSLQNLLVILSDGEIVICWHDPNILYFEIIFPMPLEWWSMVLELAKSDSSDGKDAAYYYID